MRALGASFPYVHYADGRHYAGPPGPRAGRRRAEKKKNSVRTKVLYSRREVPYYQDMDITERRARAAEKKANKIRMEAEYAKNAAVVAANCCPQCGCTVHRNLALTGWIQCDRYGSPGFQKIAGPSCSWQGFLKNER